MGDVNLCKDSLQSADGIRAEQIYQYAFNHINENDTILNIGCGTLFTFENFSRKKNVKISCCDMLPADEYSVVPDDVHFFVNDIEEPVLFENKFDVICSFEVIEHIDKTDVFVQNCYNNLKDNGLLILGFPNLASIYCRFELLLGFQPHVLEVSNINGNFGAGVFGRMNNKTNLSIHHIRGITHRAMKEMLQFNKFEILKIYGYDHRIPKLSKHIPSLSTVNVIIAKKTIIK